MNLFRYCGDDPVDNSDPLGLAADQEYYRDDDELKNYVRLVKAPGSFIVAGHGSQSSDRYGQVVNPRYAPNANGTGPTIAENKIINAITSAPALASRSQTLLLVCSSGSAGSTLAKHIAAATGKPVIAPNKLLWINPKGQYFAADKLPGDGKPTPDLSKPGSLIQYSPDGSSKVYKNFELIPGK
jgi:hypothetical protein